MHTKSNSRSKRPSRAKSGAKAETDKLSPAKLKELALLPEPISAASQDRKACHECGRYEVCGSPFVREEASGWTGKLLLLFGQRPSQDALDYIISLALECGHAESDLWFFDAVACGGRKPTTKQLRACRPFFVELIQRRKPEYVLAFGDVALRYATDNGKLKNITENRGRSFMVPGCEETNTHVYCTYDADSIIDGAFHNRGRVEEDLRRVREGGLPSLSQPRAGICKASEVGVDTEFMPDGKVITLSVSDAHASACSDVSESATTKRLLSRISTARTFVGHQVTVDLDSVIRLAKQHALNIKPLKGWLQGKNILDTIALARMVDENRPKGGYKLENLLRSSHHTPVWKQDDRVTDESDPSSWPKDYRVERCRLDAWASSVLAEELRPHAKGPIELTHRIIQTLRRIYHTGAYVDLRYTKKITGEFFADASKAKRKLLGFASSYGMTEFSPTNDNHLRELLFEHCGLVASEKTKTTGVASVNKTFLKNNAKSEVVKTLLEFNTADKRHSTYGLGLAKKFLVTGDPRFAMLRFRVNPLGARTGRRASDKPNAQNWPKDVRKIIVSRFNDGVIADNDYSKLEVILFAFIAREWKLLEFFLEGNGYIAVGKELFNKEVKEDTDEYRSVKSVVLGVQYGMGAYKLAYQLWNNVGVKLSSDWEEHVELASRIRQKYLDKFPGIPRYIWNQKRALLRDHQVSSLTGRVRHLTCPYGEDTPGFGHLLNQAINFPIQCHAVGTKILTEDLRWIPVEALNVGDTLLAFDEHRAPYQRRKWKSSQVIAAYHDKAECYEVILESGHKFTVTKEHIHLTQNCAGHQRWVTTDQLAISQNHSNLVKVCSMDLVPPNEELGYLAGAFDADGHLGRCATIRKGVSFRLSFGQLHNSMLIRVEFLLTKYGFKYRKGVRAPGIYKGRNQKEFFTLDILGGKPEVLRFLSLCRPPRLLAVFNRLIPDLGQLRSILCDRVISVTSIGMREIVRLGTSSSTYVAEGYATHNSLASDVTGSAMIDVEEALLSKYKLTYEEYHWRLMEGKPPTMPLLINEVHDDLVYDMPSKGLRDNLAMISEIMSAVPTLRALLPTFDVPLNTGQKVGSRWGEDNMNPTKKG
ncbi:MAG: DNA polymerase [Cetobacterium sp.]